MREIATITIEDKEYPNRLKHIPDPPKVLYYKGDIKAEEPCFAVVGTRVPSSYGKQVTLEFSGKLAASKITIVSGLAPGIDTVAHTAAVEQGGRTIAVLGTGIDEESMYPRENIALARKIVAAGGLLLSEYPPGTPGSRFSFPRRNRIISGISLGVLVTEAKEKSGSLITANYAFSHNRKVFAIPGSIYVSNTQGPHLLIKRGAQLVDNAYDILQELGLSVSTESREPTEGNSQEETLILKALAEELLHLDKIIEKTKLGAATVARTLTVLEVQQKVRNLGNNIYAHRA